MSWLEAALIDTARTRFGGQSYVQRAAVDLGPLSQKLAASAESKLGKPVQLLGTYAYAPARSNKDSNFPPRLDIMRSASEEGWTVRTCGRGGSSSGDTAPAVALAADLVHACAIRGDVDKGIPTNMSGTSSSSSSSAGSSGSPGETQAVLALLAAPLYLPALTRAAQHGRAVVIGSRKAEWPTLLGSMSAELKRVLAGLQLDGLLGECVVGREEFRAGGPPAADIAARLHAALLASNSAGSAASSSGSSSGGVGGELASSVVTACVRELGLLKALRRQEVSVRALVRSADTLFTLKEAAGSPSWSCVLKPVPAPVVAPASTATSSKKSKDKEGSGKQTGKEKVKGKDKGEQMERKTEAAVVAAPAPAAADVGESKQSQSKSKGKTKGSKTAAVAAPAAPAPAVVAAAAPPDSSDAVVTNLLQLAEAAGVLSDAKDTVVNLGKLLAAAGVPKSGARSKDALVARITEQADVITAAVKSKKASSSSSSSSGSSSAAADEAAPRETEASAAAALEPEAAAAGEAAAAESTQ